MPPLYSNSRTTSPKETSSSRGRGAGAAGARAGSSLRFSIVLLGGASSSPSSSSSANKTLAAAAGRGANKSPVSGALGRVLLKLFHGIEGPADLARKRNMLGLSRPGLPPVV